MLFVRMFSESSWLQTYGAEICKHLSFKKVELFEERGAEHHSHLYVVTEQLEGDWTGIRC